MREDIEKYLNILRQQHGAEQAEKMLAYIDMVLIKNEHINLTAVRNREEAIIKHIADSLSVLELPEFWEAKSIIDVGTGAGFPGAILAIACPDKEFVLLDSTLKKLKIIEEISEKLEISNIVCVHERAEDAGRGKYAESFDLCVSRAVADMSKLVSWCLPFVNRSGSFIAYKGSNYKDEVERAASFVEKAGGRIDRIIPCPSDFEEIDGHVLAVVKRAYR